MRLVGYKGDFEFLLSFTTYLCPTIFFTLAIHLALQGVKNISRS